MYCVIVYGYSLFITVNRLVLVIIVIINSVDMLRVLSVSIALASICLTRSIVLASYYSISISSLITTT